MKRVFCLVCIVVLLFSACSAPESETTEPEQTVNNTQSIYELSFDARAVCNNSVGSDWSFTYRHNGETIKSGHRILLPVEAVAFRTIGVEVREDDKLDDIGTGVLQVAICDRGSGNTQVTVTENGGHYKGNTAVWEISCTVKLIGKQ